MQVEETTGGDARKLRIAAFPTGEDIWRIDWFGPVAFPDRMLRRRHPSVLVHLSKVVHPQAIDDPWVLLQPDSTLPADRQTKRWVSVGTTMLLRIGDLWRDQTLVARPDYEQAMFDNVLVDRETITIVKAGSSFDDGSFLLPLTEHPWHLNNTHSYCVRVALPRDRFLVVPCMEMARFYFGSSSELLSRLFAPPLTKEQLFSKVSTDFRSRMILELAERMPKASAEDIARIAGSDVAWRAAALISISCLKASTARRDVYPQAVFPFEGATTLQAVGKWLPRGSEQQGTFIAFQLQTCSHPFPFRTLRFKASGGVHRSNANGQATASHGNRQRASAPESKNSTLRERDPSAKLAPVTQAVRGRRRFTDLERKTVVGIRTFVARATEFGAGKAPVVDRLSVGEPGSVERIRPTSIVDDRGTDEPGLPPNFLRCVVQALETIETLTVRLMTASQEDGWTVPVTLLYDEDGVIDEVLLVASESNRPRRVAVFGLVSGVEQALLVIVEGEKLLPLLYPVNIEDLHGIWSVVPNAAKDFAAKIRAPWKADITIDMSEANAAHRLERWIVGLLVGNEGDGL